MLRYSKWILLLLLLSCMLWFICETDFVTMSHSIAKVGWDGFSWILLSTFLAYLLATIGWRVCLLGTKYNIFQLFVIRHVGEVITLINPASILGGETTKWMLMKSDNLSREEVAMSIVVSRVILIYTQLICFGLVYIFMILSGAHFPILISWILLSFYLTIFLLLGVISFWYQKRKRKLQSEVIPRKGIAKLFFQFKRTIDQSVLFFRDHPIAVLVSSLMGLLHWIVGGIEIYLILRFIGLEVSFSSAILMDLGVVFFKTAGAIVPGQIGIEEFGNKVMLEMIGVKIGTTWIVVSLLRRARQLCWIGIGLLGYIFLNRLLYQTETQPNGNFIRKS